MATVSQITSRPESGLAHIDALIGAAQPWNYVGRPVLYYSFSVTSGAEISSTDVRLATRTAFNESQEAHARDLIEYVSQVTGIRFAEIADGAQADIHFANADLVDPWTAALCVNGYKYTYDRSDQVTTLEVDSWVYLDSREWGADNFELSPGGWGYETLLHEVGHVLGLKHPFDGDDVLPTSANHTGNTVMSYSTSGGAHSTFSPYDIAALDWLYGRDGLGGALGLTAPGRMLTGSELGEPLSGGGGNDVFTGAGGDDRIDGGAGRDLACFAGPRDQFHITRTFEGGFQVRDLGGREGVDTLANVERLQFDDLWVALDITGHGGQAHRLYQAAFDRDPDLPGLGFQINQLDIGHTLVEVANNFIRSPEFLATYGALSDLQFVNQLYANVLDRAPDAQGLAFHTGNLEQGMSRAQVLVGFSESPENQANVIGSIENGMAYFW